jgi:hypothetical protein
MKKICLFFVVAFAITKAFSQCACCAGAGVGSSNGDYNNGILTLPKKMIMVESYADYRTIKNGNAPEDDEKLLKSMFISSLGLRYGITNKITVSALLPYVSLHTNSGNDKGIGDLILMSTFNVYSKNNFNLALQAGIELPTGIRKNSNFDNTTVIVGSGSFDPIFGIAFSKRWGKLTMQGNGFYKNTTSGFENNYYGSLSTQNLIISYLLKGKSNFCSTDASAKNETLKFGVNIFGGYYGEWLDKLKENDIVDENSGHYLGFATLGANIFYKKWAFPLTVSIPLIKKMNGQQNDAGYRLRLGIIKSF